MARPGGLILGLPAREEGRRPVGVRYALRWVNAKGEAGPWSEIYVTKVPG